jgi:hypothetical protein
MSNTLRYFRQPLSLAGSVLATTSAVLFLVVFLADLFGLTAIRISASCFSWYCPASSSFRCC